MATRNATGSYVENSEDVSTKLRDLGDGPDGTPYLESRIAAGVFASAAKIATYDFTPGTTTDDAGDVIADADDIVLDIGFKPEIVWVSMNHATPATGEAFLRFAGMNTDYAWKLDSTVVPTITDNMISFQAEGITILNGLTTDAQPHRVFVMGK